MKHLFAAATLVLLSGFATTSAAAPLAPGANLPNPKAPQVTKKPNFGSKSGGNKAPSTSQAKSGTQTGVVQSMTIGKQGEIIEINMKIAGSSRTVWIKGCGAKSAAHPLLNWAFQERRLVYIATDNASCFGNVIIKR